jgi:peptidoglycan-associated lipoprotein
VAGCAHDPPPPPITTTTTPTVKPPANKNTDQVVNLDKEIRQSCSIDDTTRAPKFDFDSTDLSSNDRDVLSKLATCLTTGTLKGRSVALVGRADPRGETEYNMNLGESRAAAVKRYLSNLGVEGGHLRETSRGALDAKGKDEETWRQDRRVDVMLAK